ncbi:MAG: phosphatase PAP2 family protein [Eubacterium sp.]|nr:phosphatase PAP2 family protein [Eubacterium sp.]
MIYCYIFWAFGYCYVAHTYRNKPKKLFRFVTADMLSRFVCLFFFIVLPTTNVRPEITGTAFSDDMARFLYSIDQPVNLFPSIHCLVSWLCFVGIRNAKKAPLFMKLFEVISAVAIMASTQFLKQHYIVDVIAGIALAEICWMLCKYIKLPKYVRRFFNRINMKLEKVMGGKVEEGT